MQSEGLKFSVDTLAEKLKISKKTIYKYFPNKEALALELYKQYYQTANEAAKQLLAQKEPDAILDLLLLYYESKKMIRNEIFNKYNLNEVIRSYAEKQNDIIWSAVTTALKDTMSTGEIEIIRVIVDGTFEKLCISGISPKSVIERLVHLI